MYNIKVVYNSCFLPNTLNSNLLASAVLNVDDFEASGRVLFTKGVRAFWLVANCQVESADLVPAIFADGVKDVDKLVVLGNPAVWLRDASTDIAHAVGGRERQLAVCEEVLALVGRDCLIFHGDAASHLRAVRGRLAKGKVVPGIVRDVVGTTRLVNLEEVEAAALIRHLDADVVAGDCFGPVGNTVGVDLASNHTDGRRVLIMGGDADPLATLGDDTSRDGGSRGDDDGSD